MNTEDMSKDELDAHVAKVRIEALQQTNPFAALKAKHDRIEKDLVELHGKDYDKTVMSFTINKAERGVINAWLESLKPEIMELQRKRGGSDPFGMDEPYYGAIGGGVSYHFTGTGLGSILIVKETTTGKELNVTDELEWFFFG